MNASNNTQNVLSNEIEIVALFDYDSTTTGNFKGTHIMIVKRPCVVSTKVSHMIANKHVENGGTFSANVEITKHKKTINGFKTQIVLIDNVEYAMFKDGSTAKI